MAGSAYNSWPDWARAALRNGYRIDIVLLASVEKLPPHSTMEKEGYLAADSRLRELSATTDGEVIGIFNAVKEKREKRAQEIAARGGGEKLAEWHNWWQEIENKLTPFIREKSLSFAQIVARENGLPPPYGGRSRVAEDARSGYITGAIRAIPDSEDMAVAALVAAIYVESRNLVGNCIAHQAHHRMGLI